MTKIIPNPVFEVIRPDEVAECWDGVGDDLYEDLWECVGKYDNSYRENIEDIGPHDVIGINCVKDFWDDLSIENQIKLNALAADEAIKWENL